MPAHAQSLRSCVPAQCRNCTARLLVTIENRGSQASDDDDPTSTRGYCADQRLWRPELFHACLLTAGWRQPGSMAEDRVQRIRSNEAAAWDGLALGIAPLLSSEKPPDIHSARLCGLRCVDGRQPEF